MTNLYDQYLLFRIKIKRDKEAFGVLYDRYVKAIYRFVYLRLPSKETAEDVTAETFLRCWNHIQQHRDVLHFRALLYKIARNLIVDTYRKTRSVAAFSELTVTFSSSTTSSLMNEDEISDRLRQKAQIEAGIDWRLIMERISQLKDDYRDVIILRLVDGLGFADIAQILEKNSGHARVIYHRAMHALEQLVSKKESYEPKDH